MQICYRALFDVFKAIENELAKKERSYRVSYAKDAVSVKQFNFSCFFFFFGLLFILRNYFIHVV